MIAASKAASLQRLDGILGPPICWFLSLWNIMGSRWNGRTPRTIGFFKLGEQGSTVLAIPAIREAVRRVGRENVYFVCFRENRKILDLLGLIPEVNIMEVRTDSVGMFLGSVLRVVRRLRGIPLDAGVDLDFFARATAILMRLSGAGIRVGLHAYFGEGPGRGNLLTHRPRYNPHIHTSRLFFALTKAIDEDPGHFPQWDDPGPQPAIDPIRIPAQAMESMQNRLREKFGTGAWDSILLLNANCSDMIPLRRWAPENFVEIAKRVLTTRPHTRVIFTGAPVEKRQAAELAALVGSPACLSMAGETTLEELFALYECSSVLLTNDSGPAHFASLTSIRVVALFGPETPALFGPLSSGSVSLSAGLPCSPCVSAQNNRLSACRNNVCMQNLGVDRVYGEVLRALDAKEAGAKQEERTQPQ